MKRLTEEEEKESEGKEGRDALLSSQEEGKMEVDQEEGQEIAHEKEKEEREEEKKENENAIKEEKVKEDKKDKKEKSALSFKVMSFSDFKQQQRKEKKDREGDRGSPPLSSPVSPSSPPLSPPPASQREGAAAFLAHKKEVITSDSLISMSEMEAKHRQQVFIFVFAFFPFFHCSISIHSLFSPLPHKVVWYGYLDKHSNTKRFPLIGFRMSGDPHAYGSMPGTLSTKGRMPTKTLLEYLDNVSKKSSTGRIATVSLYAKQEEDKEEMCRFMNHFRDLDRFVI